MGPEWAGREENFAGCLGVAFQTKKSAVPGHWGLEDLMQCKQGFYTLPEDDLQMMARIGGEIGHAEDE